MCGVGGGISHWFIFKRWYLYGAIFYIPVVPARSAASPQRKRVPAPPAAVSGVRGHSNQKQEQHCCFNSMTPPKNETLTKLRLRPSADIKGLCKPEPQSVILSVCFDISVTGNMRVIEFLGKVNSGNTREAALVEGNYSGSTGKTDVSLWRVWVGITGGSVLI